MKKTGILLICLFITLGIYSANRTHKEMRDIAKRHFSNNAKSRMYKNRCDVQSAEITEVCTTATFGVYEYDDAFVVVGRDSRVPQILGYSNTSFNENNIATGLKWWMNAMDRALMEINSGKRLSAMPIEFTPVDNFLETTWDQGNPYNSLCPPINGKQPPTGCVATAMAQILYYHKYPEKSTGMGYYKTNANNTEHKQQLTTIYNWEAMLPSYALTDYSEESKTAVAELMLDCGLATGMTYGTSGSGANSRVAANGFINNLGFTTSGIRFADRAYYSDEEWMGIVYSELAAKRPIYYTGSDLAAQSGHAFVFSGVDSDGLVYVNWGWGGSGNGFYNINLLKPSTSNDNYSEGQDMIYGITPRPEELALDPKCSEILSEYPYDLETYDSESMKGYVRVNFVRFWNGYISGFQGKVSLCVENQEGKTTAYTLYEVVSPSVVPIYYYFSQDDAKNTLKNLSKLEAGTYKAYIGSKSVNDTKYQPIRCPGGPIYYTIVKDNDGWITVKDNDTSGITRPTYIMKPENIYDLHGRYFGTSSDALPKGLYIVGGKKVVK